MVRSCDENGTKKGAWTVEEDMKLIAYIVRYGCWNWHQLPNFAGLSRRGKSCRQRWMNYLRPDIRRGSYSKEEEETIVKLHKIFGNRWCAIAAQLPGRTCNEIKNHCKKLMKNTDETPSYPNLEAALDQRIKEAIFPNAESTTNSPQVTQKTDDHVDNWVNFVEDFNVSSMEAYTDNQFFNDFCTEPVLADNSYGPSGFYTPLMDSEFLHPLFDGDFL